MVIANISNEVSKAHLWVDYTLGGLPGRVDLGQLSLAPGGFQNLDLAAEMLGLGVPGPVDDAGVDIEYSAAPGSVIARIVSFDRTQDFSFDVPMKDPLAEMMGVNTGGYPWRLDGGYNTVVHLKNSTAKPVDAIMQIRYDEGNYNPELIKLGPHQTVAVDIRRLRDAQQRDIRGGVMPRDVISGQVKWIEMEPGSLIGRAEVVNVGEGTASSFSCGGGGCGASFSGSTFSPSPVAGAAGGSGQAMAQEWDKDSNGTMYGPYDKTGSPTTWTSSDTSVATVTGGSVSFVSTGSCTINASWTATVYTGSNCTPTSVPAAAGGPVAVVSVTLSLRYGGTLVISSDDSARQEFIDCTGSDGLSTRLSNGTTCGAVWRTCVEIVGTVTPSNYTGMIVIHRQIDDKRIYNENNVLISSSSNAPDESDDVFRDSDPQSGNSMGKVYDTDGPTISFVAGDPVGAIRRKRVNYHQWATLGTSGATVSSANLQWFSVLSVTKTSGADQINTAVSGDNVAGNGTTKLTWNLQ